METQDQLAKYSDQINEISLFAKRIGYDIEKGIDELLKLWLKEQVKFWDQDKEQKDQSIRIVKGLINKSK